MENAGDDADPRNNGSQERGSQEHGKSLKRSWKASGPVAKLTCIFAGVAALSTTVYAIFGILQWSVMSNTLALERPWIGPTARTLVPSQNGQLRAVGWHYQNGGRTVATRMRFNLEFKIGPTEPTESNAPISEECRKGELPGKEGNIAIPGSFDYLTPIAVSPEIAKSMDAVYQGKVGLYIVGCVDYSDTARRTWYRTEVLELFLPKAPNFWAPPFGNDSR